MTTNYKLAHTEISLSHIQILEAVPQCCQASSQVPTLHKRGFTVMSELVTAEELPCFCGQLKNPLFSFASCEHLAATSPANSFHSLHAFSNTRNIPQLSAAASCRLTNKQQENRRLGASHVCHAELSWDLCHLVCSVTPHSALQGWEAKGSHKQRQGATNRNREPQTEPVLPKGGGWKRH